MTCSKNDLVFPWAIARLGAVHEKSRIVGRFFNRQDAEDQVRFLNRVISNRLVRFVVIYDMPINDD